MIIRIIDALRNISLRFRHECFVISGIAVFGAIYLFSLNRNLLYLSLLWVIYIISSALFTRFKEMLVGLVVCVFLVVAPVNIPGVKFVDPAPYTETINQGYVMHYALPKSLEIWQYVFQVDEIEHHQLECGGNLQGRLLIDGLDLSGLEISLGGNASAGSTQQIIKYAIEEIQIPLDVSASGRVVISLRVKMGTSPKIFLGPEAHGFDVYSDAVWLEFKNERCSVLYHAQRRVIPAESGLYRNSMK